MQALTKFDSVINLKTAKALGVTTSSSLRCTWSLLALFGRGAMSDLSPLFEQKRT
jgi:hypothetical protein